MQALMGDVKGTGTLQVPVDASINGRCERFWYTPSSGRESNYPTERNDYQCQCINHTKYITLVCNPGRDKQEKTHLYHLFQTRCEEDAQHNIRNPTEW